MTSFVSNVGGTFVRQMAGVLLSFGLVVMLARVLGPQHNGQYTVALLLPTLLAILLNLGVPSATVYFVAKGDLTLSQATREVRRLWRVLSAAGLVLGGLLIALAADSWFSGAGTLHLSLALVAFPFLLADSYVAGLFQAIQDFRRYNLSLLLGPAAALVLVGIFTGLLELGVTGAVAAYVLGRTLVVVGVWFHFRRRFGALGHAKEHASGHLVSYGWRVHVSNVLAFLNYRVDLLLVNGLMTPAAAGIYVIAVQIGERLWMIPQAVSTVVMPKLVSLHGEEGARRRLTPLMLRWVLMATFVASLIVAALSDVFVELVFGGRYREAAEALRWLLPGIVAWSGVNILSVDLAARGKPEWNIVTAATSLGANVICNLIWIPSHGIKGAAMASAISYSLSLPVAIALYRKATGCSLAELLLPTAEDHQLFRRI